ncbi:Osmotin, thaumatin-like protein [Lichtheimia hyalospora FSU 10163]|nr:Osmotin, thaumatin-like protein [Lichtheimia hyalospora FSU 10163]
MRVASILVATSLFLSAAHGFGLGFAADGGGGGGGGGGSKKIVVSNNCKDTLKVGVSTNGQSGGGESFDLSPGSSQTITKSDHWGGRVWGAHCGDGGGDDGGHCSGGANNPASLAEFFFKGMGGHDYYDISLVDGYNLPMTINPDKGGGGNGKYKCGSPSCDVPSCPKEYAVKDSKGNVTGCKSSCSATNSDEHCCKGKYDDPKTCKPDKASENVKKTCPDAYSFAYDDQTSTFNCAVDTYEVKFC